MEELQNIQDYIHVIRGHRVMLDRDIATFYGVETKRLYSLCISGSRPQ